MEHSPEFMKVSNVKMWKWSRRGFCEMFDSFYSWSGWLVQVDMDVREALASAPKQRWVCFGVQPLIAGNLDKDMCHFDMCVMWKEVEVINIVNFHCCLSIVGRFSHSEKEAWNCNKPGDLCSLITLPFQGTFSVGEHLPQPSRCFDSKI